MIQQRLAKAADADQTDMPHLERGEDAGQIVEQARHVVADAALAELTQIGQVLAHLAGLEPEHLADLLGRHDGHALVHKAHEQAAVSDEPPHRGVGDLLLFGRDWRTHVVHAAYLPTRNVDSPAYAA